MGTAAAAVWLMSAGFLGMIEVNRVGQVPHGLISSLRESCLAQHATTYPWARPGSPYGTKFSAEPMLAVS